jgi:hypothetical protein
MLSGVTLHDVEYRIFSCGGSSPVWFTATVTQS